MNSPSLHRASALSIVAHVGFVILFLLLSRRAAVVSPKVYTVNIVTPEAERPARPVKAPPVPPKKKAVQPAKAPEAKPKLPPKKEAPPKPKPAVKPEAEAPKQEDPSNYLTERLSALKEEKQASDYKQDALEQLAERKRLQNIKQKAYSLSQKETEAVSAAARASELEAYLGRVHDSIYEEWLFPAMDITGLETTVVVTIMANGRIVINRFASPSGSKLFDQSAIKALQKASPVEPPPFNQNLEVNIRFIPHEK